MAKEIDNMENEIIYYSITIESISFFDKNKNKIKEIFLSDIDNIEILEESEFEVKNKSTFARMIIGGIIGGTAGALFGIASSLIPKIKEIKIAYMVIHNNSEEFIFSADKKLLEKIKKQILKIEKELMF